MSIVHPFDVEATALVLGKKHKQVGSFEFHREIGHLQNVWKLLFVEQLLLDVKNLGVSQKTSISIDFTFKPFIQLTV